MRMTLIHQNTCPYHVILQKDQTRSANPKTKLILSWFVGLKDALQFSPQTQIMFNGFSSADENITFLCTAGQNWVYELLQHTKRFVCTLMWIVEALHCDSNMHWKLTLLKTRKEVTYTSFAPLWSFTLTQWGKTLPHKLLLRSESMEMYEK